ncbi:hypothetical protein [Runella slithyformis]|uniref:Uncharacterized protein n=1 Tax=Runella slithyformis (strain ATCC 29530 / DSM 19594 / LMG 11500 / NCIMB 11436 / LSU 4) TaxID=761193 RepID=A0A7U4E6M3_RUNSL|nr:hypothetical protein [Runella slithyformis]AEI49728.1 hypothetical protein Runsl_3361 [Runella slithyformis DSM 19594]
MKILEKTVQIILGILLVCCLLLSSPLFIPYVLFKGFFYLKAAYLKYLLSPGQKRAANSDPAPAD